MVRVKSNEHGKCFHIAAPDLGIVEHSSASPSPFASSSPSFGFNTSNPFTTAAASSSLFGSPQPLGFARFATPDAPSFGSIAPPSFGSPQPLGFARFATPNKPSFGSIAPPSFGTSFPNTQFPWSSNTSSSAAANDNACLFSSHIGKDGYSSSGNSSPSASSGDNAKIANATTTTTRACSCGGKSNNPPSENNISSTPLQPTPLFGTPSVLPENTKFLAPQETSYPFQVSPFAQFPWNSTTAPPLSAASTQFPWSNNNSSAAANNNTYIFSSDGNAKTRSCACVGRFNNPSSGNNINSSVQNPLNAATFELPINGNLPSAFPGDHAKIANTTSTTRSCTCEGKLNNPTSENNTSSTTPLFGPSSVPPESSSFLAPQETPNPFQFHPFSQFPWSGSSTALPFYAAIPSNNYYNGFTSLYGVPLSTNSKYPYGLPQHILLMALSPVPTTPLFSLPYSPYATPYDNQLKHCTCCCKCNKANDDPEPKHGFPGNNISKENPPSSGFSFAPDVQRKIPFGTTWPGSSSSNSNNTGPFKFATPWAVHSPFLASPLVKKNKQPFECKYTETVVEGGEKFMSISAMPSVGNQSVEELRWNNYQSQGTTATRDGNGSGDKENVGFGIQ